MFAGKLKYIVFLVCCLLVCRCFAQPIPLNKKYVDSITALLPSLPDDTVKVNNLVTLASMYVLVNPAITIQYAKQGIRIAEKINYPEGKISCLGQTAFFYAITGEWAKATADINEAMPLCEKYQPERLIYLYNLMYINAATKGDDQEALMYAQKALHHPSFQGLSEVNKFPTYMQLGRIYQLYNRLDSAIYYANILNDNIKKYGSISPDLISNSNTLNGQIAVKQKDYAKAIRYYHQGNYYTGLAEVYSLLNQRDSVIYYSMIILKNGEVQKNLKFIQEAAKTLAAVYEKSEPVKANTYLKMYIAASDSLYSNEKLKQLEAMKLNAQQNKFDVEKNAIATRNRYILFSLSALLAFLFIFLVMLWRNNRFKQHANAKLQSAYKDLQSTQAQLIQSEKMASLGELTASIAHEIQNPLNFVNNFSEVNNELIEELKAERSKLKAEEQDELLNDIFQNNEKIALHGKRADAIVKGMLQHSRQTKGVKEPTDINALCDEYLHLSYHGLRAKDKSFNADFKTDFDESIGKINVVSQDIGRVLLNLFNNAFYAVNERKNLTGLPDLLGLVTVQTKKLNDKIEIVVKDNGNGIPPNIIDKIFQPFFTTKPTGQGTGLGLSLAYDIITKEHKGTIKAESPLVTQAGKKDEGSKFIIQLPV